MDNINFDDLLDSIKRQECILLLGPEIKMKNGLSQISSFYNQLAKEGLEMIHRYYANDELFLFKEEMYKGFFIKKIRRFYQTEFELDIADALAQVPFHLVISCTPDEVLFNSLKKYDCEPVQVHFSKISAESELKEPDINKPLVYKILGGISEDESLILSHDDLFGFLQLILGEKKLPLVINKLFKKAKELIFIGFQFDKWYLQLILRLFELHKGQYAFNRIAASNDLTKEPKELCLEQFRIKFINNDIHTFVKELHKECIVRKMNRKIRAEDVSSSAYLASQKEERLQKLKSRLETIYRLLAEYEKQEILKSDPIEKLDIQEKIKMLKIEIDKTSLDIKNL